MIKIIAECGLNFSDFNEAVEYAEKAKEIGADIIKYQWVENKDLPQMNKGEWKALKNYCNKIGIEFMCTPSSKEIFDYIYYDLYCDYIKIGSDHASEDWLTGLARYIDTNELFAKILKSDGYYSISDANMYCVSLYPCDDKFIDFDKMKNKKYIGFSDHTLRYDKEWCDRIKACKNIKYYEKHFKLKEDCIDTNVSLRLNQFRELIKNMRS